MADDQFVVRRVAWRELCPWLMIFRCFRISISLPILFLATLGALVSPVGDEFLRPRSLAPQPTDLRISAGYGTLLDAEGTSGVYRFFVEPLRRLFDRRATTSEFLANLMITLWNFAVWGFIGGAITRMAIVQLGRDERVSMWTAMQHAGRNWLWYAAAPLFPLLGIALLLLPLAVLGLVLRFDFFVVIGGILWLLVLIAGLGMAVLLVGLLGGWPLMWPTISAEENSDAFEAFHRSFSYLFQRPLSYVFYIAIALIFGEFSWFFVDHFATAIIALNHWAISFGAGSDRVTDILNGAESPSTMLWAGAKLIGWWNYLVRAIAQGFNFSYFLCVMSAIYLLMRREVDQTDFDDVYVTDEIANYGLPPLRTGPDGVPEVVESADDDKEAVS